MKTIALSLLLSSGTAAFAPAAFGRSKTQTSLHVSAVHDIITKQVADSRARANDARVVNAFETQTPESVGITAPAIQKATTITKIDPRKQSNAKNGKKKRKHNFGKQAHLHEEPDLDFFTLHSSAVSHLEKNMPVSDIVRAIKRAQNLHDVHDLATIGGFLMEHCDEQWGFGYRGSLLSRLAVAALHCDQLDVAKRAIQTRRTYERPSMQPHESAAIVRGLMRVGKIEEAWDVLEDELRLPMNGMDLQAEASQEVLKQRARALASIASRHYHQGEPYVAARALRELGTLGSAISEAHMESGDLNMPWVKLAEAATKCEDILRENGWNVKHVNTELPLSSNLTELVQNAMNQFPCPNGEEECSLEDHFNATP